MDASSASRRTVAAPMRISARQYLRRADRCGLSTTHCGFVAVPSSFEQLHERGLVAHLLFVLRAQRDDLVALLDQQTEDAFAFGRIGGVLGVQVGGGVAACVRDRVLGLSCGAEQGRDDGEEQDTEDHRQ